MTVASDSSNVAQVERFLAAFDRRWPTDEELASLLDPEVLFVERPNLVNPEGGERDAVGIRAGIEAGRRLLAWQSYAIRDHVAHGDVVVTRMRWTAELAIDVGDWVEGTQLRAWCVAHYRFLNGRIVQIEQHDCYDPPVPPSG